MPDRAGWFRVTAAALALAGAVGGLAAWLGGSWGLAYLTIHLLATAPGWPVGRALFGRDHLGGWIAGVLLGHAFASWGVWALMAAGHASPLGLVTAWLIATAATWALTRRVSVPLVRLPTWSRRDATAVLLFLLLVPLLVWRPFARVGERDAAGDRRYRAYFTADFVWHVTLVGALEPGALPPPNPYFGGEPLHYYWAYFLVPAAAARTVPAVEADPGPALLVTATVTGVLLVAALVLFTWTVVPNRRAVLMAVAVALLAASAEGIWVAWRLWRDGQPLETLRSFNIEAATYWILQGLSIDGLPRAIWYGHQHAAAAALGLLALTEAVAAGAAASPGAVGIAGLALGGAVTFSPFLGAVFALLYGFSIVLDATRAPRDLPRAVARHALAGGIVLAALAACLAGRMLEGANATMYLGWPRLLARNAPVETLALAAGPLLALALPGLVLRRGWTRALIASVVGLAVALVLFFFVTLGASEPLWVGWRAGLVLLLTAPALAALTLRHLLESRAAWLGPLAFGAALLAGLPTTAIDVFNAQDVENPGEGPGFHWTMRVTPAQQAAFAWLRRATPRTAIVQMESTCRGRDTRTMIPAFAFRGMYSGLPLGLVRGPEYDERAARVRSLFESSDAEAAWRLATDARIDYLYVDDTDRRAFSGAAIRKFEENPSLFTPVFWSGDVALYAVARAPGPAGARVPFPSR